MAFFPGVITRNWQLKLSALAMAVLLWTVPEFESHTSQVLESVPVRVQMNDPDWATLGDPLPATVQVTVSGPTRALVALRGDLPPIVVPVNRVSSPDTAILLLPSWFRTSAGAEVTVEDLVPSSVRLNFEANEVKAATLVFRSTGSLPQGLSLTRAPEVTPGFVRISGPASRVADLSTLSLMPLDLSQVRNSGTLVLPVDTTGLAGMAFSPLEASVEVMLEETEERLVEGIPVSLPALQEDPQLQARPATVNVVISGAGTLVRNLDPAQIRVTVSGTVARALVPGEEVRATLSVEGIPEVIGATLDPGWVLLRRPTGL